MDTASRPVRVLVVEDDEEIAQVLQRSLRLEGYEVKLAADGVRGLDEAHAFLPDIIVLDLGLPRLDGIDVAKRLRDDGDDTPILMLTARDALESRVQGLDVGADDYLVKPFERQELLARMRALLRRRPPRGMAPLRVGDLTLNPDTHEVARGDRQIDLTQREFELLEYLMRNERLVISRQKLLDEVWGYDPFSITNTIEVFVSNLRRKLEAGGEPRLLHTVRGAGYVLRVKAPADPLAPRRRLGGADVGDPVRLRGDRRDADHARDLRRLQPPGGDRARPPAVAAGVPVPGSGRARRPRLQAPAPGPQSVRGHLQRRRARGRPQGPAAGRLLQRAELRQAHAQRLRGRRLARGDPPGDPHRGLRAERGLPPVRPACRARAEHGQPREAV